MENWWRRINIIKKVYFIALINLTTVQSFDIIDRMKKITATILSTICLATSLVGCGSVSADRTVHGDDNAIARITLYSTGERGKVEPGLVACGHAYVSIENISDSDIVLGKGYTLPSGQLVTIASWEFDAHGGIWFNIEPTYISQGWFVNRKSVTREADANAIARVNEYLLKSETDKWTIFNNCTHFAARLWNVAADGEDDDVDVKMFPADLEKEVKRFKESEVGRSHDSTQPIGYFDGNTFVEFTLAE